MKINFTVFTEQFQYLLWVSCAFYIRNSGIIMSLLSNGLKSAPLSLLLLNIECKKTNQSNKNQSWIKSQHLTDLEQESTLSSILPLMVASTYCWRKTISCLQTWTLLWAQITSIETQYRHGIHWRVVLALGWAMYMCNSFCGDWGERK